MTHQDVAHPVDLTSVANRHVKGVLNLRHQRTRNRLRQLIAEGDRQVTRTMDAGLTLRQLYWCRQMVGDHPLPTQRFKAGDGPWPACFTVTKQLMAKMAYRQNPQGVLGLFDQPYWSLEDLAGTGPKPAAGPGDLWLVAVGTQKPGNLGSMVRSAEAAGCNGVLVADAVVDPFNANAIHASTGAVFRLPVVGASTDAILAFLNRRGVRIVAAVPGADKAYCDVDLTVPVALVVGPEDVGLNEVWRSATAAGAPKDPADSVWVLPKATAGHRVGPCQVSIPMGGQVVDSLNASVAAAVLLFEAVRQRRIP